MKNADWREYRRLPGRSLRQEGCTMSTEHVAALRAGGPLTPGDYEKDLYELEQQAKVFYQAKKESAESWRYAESNAEHARRADANAEAAMQNLIDLVKRLAAPSAIAALQVLAQHKDRSDEFPRPLVPTVPAETKEDKWGEDDEVELAAGDVEERAYDE